MNRVTFLSALVLLLLAVNSVTLYLLFKKDGSRERRNSQAMFFKKLRLDTTQEHLFETLRKVHFQKRDSLRKEDIHLRKSMAEMITKDVKDSASIDSITNLLAANRKKYETNFYHHFQQLHSLLKPEQQQHFNEVLDAIIKRQSPPPIKK